MTHLGSLIMGLSRMSDILSETSKFYSSSSFSKKHSSPPRISRCFSCAVCLGFVISRKRPLCLSHRCLLNKTKAVLCRWALRSMVNLFLHQKTRFRGLNHNCQISIICTCNKDTGGTGNGTREKMLKFSGLCLECTAVNYLIFIYLETFLSKMIDLKT